MLWAVFLGDPKGLHGGSANNAAVMDVELLGVHCILCSDEEPIASILIVDIFTITVHTARA